jgi:hypothetical protein
MMTIGSCVKDFHIKRDTTTVAAAEEGQETEQVEQEGDHRDGIVSGSELRDQ